jgi:hypothetical protein
MNQLEKFERVVISSVREGQFDGQQLSYVTTRESSEIASSAQRQQSRKKVSILSSFAVFGRRNENNFLVFCAPRCSVEVEEKEKSEKPN